jgi:hypothetical protein
MRAAFLIQAMTFEFTRASPIRMVAPDGLASELQGFLVLALTPL